MDKVAKLFFWLERHGTTASWEEIERKFKRVFPYSSINDLKPKQRAHFSRLNGLLVSNHMVRFGKRVVK